MADNTTTNLRTLKAYLTLMKDYDVRTLEAGDLKITRAPTIPTQTISPTIPKRSQLDDLNNFSLDDQ